MKTKQKKILLFNVIFSRRKRLLFLQNNAFFDGIETIIKTCNLSWASMILGDRWTWKNCSFASIELVYIEYPFHRRVVSDSKPGADRFSNALGSRSTDWNGEAKGQRPTQISTKTTFCLFSDAFRAIHGPALRCPPPQGPSLTLFLIKKDQIFYAICSFAPKTRSIQSIHSMWPFDFCKYHFVEPIHSIVLICQYDCQCQTCLSLKLVNHFDRRQSDVIIQQIDVDAAPALEIEKLAEEARSKSRFIGLELRSN